MTKTHPVWIALTLLASLGFLIFAVAMVVMGLNGNRPDDIIGWMILAPGILLCLTGSGCLGYVGILTWVDNVRASR